MADKIDNLLESANKRLKLANTGIVIFKRGSKLSLRGMLPPKPSSNKVKPSQQTISLGIFANAAGIKIAEKEAQKLGAAIALGEFAWSNYLKSDCAVGSVDYWIGKFKEDYFNKRERNRKTESTWADYQKIFKKLPQGATLDRSTLLKVVLSTKPETRTRQKTCIFLNGLAKFAGLECDLSEYAGHYSSESLELRDIPSDKTLFVRSRPINFISVIFVITH